MHLHRTRGEKTLAWQINAEPANKWSVRVVQVRILCPDVEDNENLNGQLLEMEVASLLDTVSAIKARLAEVLQLPANKQRITRDGVGVLQVRSFSSMCRQPLACAGSHPRQYGTSLPACAQAGSGPYHGAAPV